MLSIDEYGVKELIDSRFAVIQLILLTTSPKQRNTKTKIIIQLFIEKDFDSKPFVFQTVNDWEILFEALDLNQIEEEFRYSFRDLCVD